MSKSGSKSGVKSRQSQHFRSLGLLLFTTLIWGTTFPILKDVVATLSPASLVGSRFLIAALVFLPFCRLSLWLWRDGALLGLVAFLSYLTQVIGLETVSANRAAFITSLNVVMVPILGWLLGRGITARIFGAAGLALAGVAVMSWRGEAGGIWSWGDLWILGCAFSYAVYILLTEMIAPRYSPLQLTAVQLITIALLGGLWTAWTGVAPLVAIQPHWQAIVYLGLFATALTTLMQVMAQRHLAATEAAIIYTLEPVFAALFSFWWLSERLGGREAIGAGMILAAMILSQLGSGQADPIDSADP